jgi:hypothetical protein
VLKANPSLRGMIYDLPHYAVPAQQLISAEALDGRCRFEGGAFSRLCRAALTSTSSRTSCMTGPTLKR